MTRGGRGGKKKEGPALSVGASLERKGSVRNLLSKKEKSEEPPHRPNPKSIRKGGEGGEKKGGKKGIAADQVAAATRGKKAGNRAIFLLFH